MLQLRDDAFKVSSAHLLKQRDALTIHMVDIANRNALRNSREQTAQLLLPFDKCRCPAVSTAMHDEIKREEGNVTAMEQEIFELRSPLGIDTD